MLIEALKGIVNVLTDHETVLWENSAPTSAFSAQTITLSDDITNYDELKVIYRASTSDTDTKYVKISVDNFLKPMSGSFKQFGFYGAYNNASWCRVANYDSDTSIRFGDGCGVKGTSTNNSTVIPIKIIGIKKIPYNRTQLVDFYSASNDTVLCTLGDAIFTIETNSNGYAKVLLPIGEVTFTSLVAKDPNNTFNCYSKTITITNQTTEVYLMPDGKVFYWFGYQNNIEVLSTANGWSSDVSGYSFKTPIFETNYIQTDCASSNSFSGVGVSTAENLNGKYKLIGCQTTSSTFGIRGTIASTKKVYASSGTAIESKAITYVESSSIIQGNYAYVTGQNGRNGKVYALWVE
jgi:hypothetical protein